MPVAAVDCVELLCISHSEQVTREVHVDSLWYCEYFAPTGQVGSVEAPAADKGSSSEENLDLSETPQRISEDLVGL